MTIEISGCHPFPTRQDCDIKSRYYSGFQHPWNFALRMIFRVTAIFVPAAASAMANLPFMPIPRQPDYVVTMVESLYGKEVAKRSATHHGDRTRADRIEGTYRFVAYYAVNGVVAVHDQSRGSSTFFSRGDIDLSYRDYRQYRRTAGASRRDLHGVGSIETQ